MHELEDHLARIRGAWMAGRGATEHAPPAWRNAVGQDAGAEAALVALTGQALQVLFRPAPPSLTPRALLPVLSAPTPPEATRSRIRRLLAARRTEEGGIRSLVLFLAARGYVTHPADWLPRATDDWAPPVYAPWVAWAASEAAGASPEILTADNWQDWPWAERRIALTSLRRGDPASARALIAAKAGGEPADRRLKLLETLEEGLTADDAPVLEGFAADRSDRVRALARQLLARLGRGESDASSAQELAAMVELARVGLLKRRNQLKLKPLKNPTQESRRHDLFGVVTLADLAKALGADETALLESVPVGEARVMGAFMAMVEATASRGPGGVCSIWFRTTPRCPSNWSPSWPSGPRRMSDGRRCGPPWRGTMRPISEAVSPWPRTCWAWRGRSHYCNRLATRRCSPSSPRACRRRTAPSRRRWPSAWRTSA
jgi:hypothetical protein